MTRNNFHLTIIILALAFCALAFTVVNSHCQTIACVGHSFCYEQQFHRADFPSWNFEYSISHPGQTCEQMLPQLQADLNALATPPDVLILWTTAANDAQQGVPVALWADCAARTWRTAQSIYPSALLIQPNTTAFSWSLLWQLEGMNQRILNYNNAIYWTQPLNVWGLTKGLANWGSPNDIGGVHPTPKGWQVIDAAILGVMVN